MELVFQTWLELGSRAILIVAQHPNSREQTNACVVLYFSPTKRTTVTGLTKTLELDYTIPFKNQLEKSW